MTQVERTKIGEAWLILAQIYGKEISGPALTVMMNSVSDLPFDKVQNALNEWPKVSKQQRHPFPAEVRDLCGSSVSPDAEATSAASRVYQGISKYGWCNGKEAQLFIGTLGWTVVQRMGGWQRVCESVGVDYDKSAFLAHAKSIARAEAEYSRAGRHDQPPELPPPSGGGGGLTHVSGVLDKWSGNR